MDTPRTEIQKVFTNAKYHPELKLTDDIWRTIVEREERKVRLQAWSSVAISFVSFAALFPALITLIRQLGESGFSEYLSLGFSDGASIASYWKEFVLTLADALPATSLLLSLALIAILLISIRRAARYVRSPLLTASA